LVDIFPIIRIGLLLLYQPHKVNIFIKTSLHPRTDGNNSGTDLGSVWPEHVNELNTATTEKRVKKTSLTSSGWSLYNFIRLTGVTRDTVVRASSRLTGLRSLDSALQFGDWHDVVFQLVAVNTVQYVFPQCGTVWHPRSGMERNHWVLSFEVGGHYFMA